MIHLTNISKQYGGEFLYKDGSVQINPGEKIGLVGPNGAGKSTIFKIIMGEERVDSGTVNIPDKLVVGYFSQTVGEMRGRSVLEETEAGAGRIAGLAVRLKDLEKKLEDTAVNLISDDEMTKLVEEYGEVQQEFELRGGYDIHTRAKEILTGLRIMPEDHHLPVETFSGGWKMRIALAKILLLNPDVLLMDEPTNHLDVESIIWLENWLSQFKGSVVMTSHDRDFMNRLVNKIVEISNRQITTYGGNYDFYERERDIRREQLIAAHKRQQDMLAKEEEFIARFAARASHAAQVQSRVKKLEKIDRIEIPPEELAMSFEFPISQRTGNDVVKFDQLSKSWRKDDGTQKSVFGGLSGLIKRLDKVAVVGVNGAGKSTLLKVVAGETEASSGSVTLGANVRIGYFSQHAMDILKPGNTVMEEIYNTLSQASISYVRSLLGAFLFSGDSANKKVSILSGGEKSRVVLAKILAVPNNLLILDEPTNHLDIRSREILLEQLKKFEGTVMIVSHDRYFLRHLVNRVIEIDHGKMTFYDGDYEHYLQEKERLAKLSQ